MIGADDPVIGMLLMLVLSLLSVLPALRVYRLWFASGGEDAANIETYGEGSAFMTRERAATNAFVNAWNDLFLRDGLRAVTLNDFTRADLAVQLPCGRWLGVQMKTTGGSVGGTGRWSQSRWDFTSVSKYPGMVVLCWTPVGPPRTGWFGRWFDRRFGPRPCGWLYDGTWLAERRNGRPPRDLGITPGARNERHALAAQQDMRALAKAVRRLCREMVRPAGGGNQPWVPYATLERARNHIPGDEHQKEKRGLDALMDLCPEQGIRCTFPTAQGSHADLVVKRAPSWVPSWLVPWVPSRLARRWERRVQAKTLSCRHNTGYDHDYYSYFTNLSIGHTRNRTPYPANAFDVLVLVWYDDNDNPRWWIIPERVLRDRGYVGDDGGVSITVHMDDNVSEEYFDEYYKGTTPDLATLFE